jgi:hypothetical protein
MSPETWKSAIRGAVQNISDEQYQRRSWLGSSPAESSSPDELLSQLLDDLTLSDFLVSDDVKLTNQQRAAGKALEAKLNLYTQTAPTQLDPERVLADERWADIRRSARMFLEALQG